MSDGFAVDTEQIRAHAANIESLRARFAALKQASSHISQNDAAYGLLCGWIAGILEGRHKAQDELFAEAEQNFVLAVEGLRDMAAAYDDVDAGTADSLGKIESGLGG